MDTLSQYYLNYHINDDIYGTDFALAKFSQ